MEDEMAAKITGAQIRLRIGANEDEYAAEFLPPDSFARHVFETKPYPVIKRAKTASDADKAECEKWGLTAEEWAEEMAAARIALAHDMKLDLITKGITPSM
jgi:hypothetical protein